MIKIVELAPDGAMNVRHVQEQPVSRQEPRERRLTVQESGNLYRIKHGMEQSKPTLRLGGAWLAKAGFTPGAQVKVSVQDGRLVIEI